MIPFDRFNWSCNSRVAWRALGLALCGLAFSGCGGGGGGGGPTPPSGLSYTFSAPIYDVCEPIAANTPTLAGGSASNFSVMPALPAGLTLDSTSGVISGAPAVLLAPTIFTVTAANSAGSTRAGVEIEVVSANPSGLDYGGATLPFAFGVTSTYAPTLANGFASTWSVIAGSLPSGFALDSITGVISGTPPYAASASSSAVTIRATNCVGANTQIALTLAVDRPVARAVYALNDSEPVISNYSFDAEVGALRSHGTTLTADAASGELAVTANGDWLIVAEGDSAALRTFRCSTDDVRLTDTGFVVSIGDMPAVALAVHPSGAFVYAATNDGHIAQFALDQQTGELTALSPSTVALAEEPSSMAMDPFGRFLFVTLPANEEVAVFSIQSGTGSLASGVSAATGAQPSSAIVAPNGSFAFVTNTSDASVSVYSIHPSSGALFPIAGSPFLTPGGDSPSSLAIDPSGAHLYVGHAFSSSIDGFAVLPGGGLSSLSLPTTALLRPPTRLLIDPSGATLFAQIESLGWFSFERGGDGLLHASISPLTVPRALCRSLAFQPGVTPLDYVVENAYLAGADGNVFQFAVSSSGALSALTPSSVVASTSALTWLDVNPNFDSVATVSPTASPTVFSVDPQGVLTLESAGTSRPTSRSIHYDVSGRYAYEVLGTVPAEIQAYTVDPITGALTPLSAIETSNGARELAVHPNGRFVYVPCETDDVIEVLEIDWATGELIPWSSTLTGPAPRQVALTDAGTLLLCLEAGTSTVVVYRVDALGGGLETLPGSFNSVGVGATSFAVHPHGTHVFVAGAAGFALRAFALDQDDGTMFSTGQTLGGSALSSLRVDPSGDRIFAARGGSTLARIEFDAATGFSLAQTVPTGPTPATLDLRASLR